MTGPGFQEVRLVGGPADGRMHSASSPGGYLPLGVSWHEQSWFPQVAREWADTVTTENPYANLNVKRHSYVHCGAQDGQGHPVYLHESLDPYWGAPPDEVPGYGILSEEFRTSVAWGWARFVGGAGDGVLDWVARRALRVRPVGVGAEWTNTRCADQHGCMIFLHESLEPWS